MVRGPFALLVWTVADRCPELLSDRRREPFQRVCDVEMRLLQDFRVGRPITSPCCVETRQNITRSCTCMCSWLCIVTRLEARLHSVYRGSTTADGNNSFSARQRALRHRSTWPAATKFMLMKQKRLASYMLTQRC